MCYCVHCLLDTMFFILLFFFFFKQKTAYEMRISDWSSDVCSSDLLPKSSVAPAARAPHVSCCWSHHRMRQAVPSATWRSGYGLSFGIPPRVWNGGLSIDRQSGVEGKSESVRVDIGGRRVIKEKREVRKAQMAVDVT